MKYIRRLYVLVELLLSAIVEPFTSFSQQLAVSQRLTNSRSRKSFLSTRLDLILI